MLPTGRCTEGWLMQYGTPVPDPGCGRCKKRLDMAVRTEALYRDGMWFHTACHRAGADQLFRAKRLPEGLTDVKRGGDDNLAPVPGRGSAWMARRVRGKGSSPPLCRGWSAPCSGW